MSAPTRSPWKSRSISPSARARRRPPSSHTYPVFVTVTRRDKSVLAKEKFNIEVAWPAGKDIVRHTETIPGIVIPRANETVSGSNFEVFVGFDLTPEQLAYNRSRHPVHDQRCEARRAEVVRRGSRKPLGPA